MVICACPDRGLFIAQVDEQKIAKSLIGENIGKNPPMGL